MAVQGRSVAFAFTSLLLPLFFLHFPQLLLALRTECGITFTGTEQNGSVTFEVEARYYKISDTCGGSPSGDSVAIWASRESGSERWIGVGTSTSGKMCDADMFMGYYNLSDPTEAVLNDRGATQNERPAVDMDETDVTVKELAVEDGKLVLRLIRPFLPNDPDDAHFSQPLKFMLATGYVYQDAQSSGGEIFYHEANRENGATAIDLSACVGCSCVSDLQDGSFEFSNVLKYVPGTVVTFFCDGGYSLLGDLEMTCGDNGIWQGTKPECKPLFQSTDCSATGYRELGNEDTKYKVRWGVVYAGLYAFELSLYSNDNNWVGIGMQPPSRASDGMCLANFVTAYLSRDSSVANIEDRFGMLSGRLLSSRPEIDPDVGINQENNPHNTHHVNVDGKALFFFTLYPSNWTLWNPMDVDPGLAHHFLFASGYVAEDDDNPAGTIGYHYSSRMMFDKTGWRDICAACEPPTLADGFVVNPNQIPRFFLGDQITFGCNRLFGLDGPATATCEMKSDKSGGVWSGARNCTRLDSWSSCNMTGKCSLSDSSPCITARWMYIPSEESLTVEIKRPVEAGKNYWVGFGFNMYDPVMCDADTTIAFFSLNDSTLLVEDGKAANYGRPLVDSDQSQIMRKKGLIEDGQMTVTVTRKLSTADAQDAQDLHDGETTYLLFATGPVASYGDTDGRTTYHMANSWASPVIRATNSECAGCEPLDEIGDAKDIVFSDTLYYNGVEATYECNDTHVLAGSSITTCSASVWSDPAPVCYPPCEEPSALQNGDVDISYPQNSDLIINATLNYTCHDGFERCGPELLTCQDNGLWDHPVFPLCRLFCVTQNVTFDGTQTEINLVYLAAGSKLWLVPEPTLLSIQKLANNGWENLVVQVKNVPPSSLIEEEVKQYRLEAKNAGRVTDAELIASGSTPLSSSNLPTSTFTFTRDNKEIHFGFFLNTLAYTHVGADDSTNRTILFMVTDIYGDTSPVLTINVQHIGTNDDPPVINYADSNGPILSFTEDDAPVGMLKRWTIRDPDHETYKMKGAKCTIEAVPSGSFAPGDEILSISPLSVCPDPSAVQYDSSTGVLQISGDGTPENYGDCLDKMTYQHVGEVFPSTQRNIRCEIFDGIHTGDVTAAILIENVNDAPTIQFPDSTNSTEVNYTPYGPAALPFASIEIKDSDSPNMTSANVTAFSLLDDVSSTDMDDAIVLPETPPVLILHHERNGGDYNMWLSGAATIETYQTYIRRIEFVNKEYKPFKLQNNDRKMTVEISDGEYRAVAQTTIKVIPQEIDVTPFNCLIPPSNWTGHCKDIALPSRPAALLHASATVLAGDSLQRDHVNIYWNGWTCLLDCSLTFTWKTYQLVRQGNLLMPPERHFFSSRINYQPVLYPVSVYLPPGINVIEVSASNQWGNSSTVRRLFLVDDHEGSSVKMSSKYIVRPSSANYGYWQTDQNREFLSVSWENHFYNAYIEANPWLLFPVDKYLTGFNVESRPLSFSGVQTLNDSGILSFSLDFYQKINASENVLITSGNFTALTKEWSYESSRPFVSGESYEFKVRAWDIFGHTAVSGASLYTDFTPPFVTHITVRQRNQSPIRNLILCSETGKRESVFTLEFQAVDAESGIEKVDWFIGNSKGTLTPQTQLICTDESCYCTTDGICQQKTYTTRINNTTKSGHFIVNIQAKSRSGLINTLLQEVETRFAGGVAPKLKMIDTVTSRSVRVSWTFPLAAIKFLVITCRKDLADQRCVSCSESSTFRKNESVVVQNLRPATIYRIQIEAILLNGSALSDTNQTVLPEAEPDKAPTNVNVSALSGKQALVTWNPPDLFYRNGIITSYVLQIEIEYAQGRWIYAQKKMRIISPQTNHTVDNLNSGRKYRISVAAATKIGIGPSSSPQEITTLEDVPDKPPTSVSSFLATTTKLTISWVPIPKDDQNGLLRRYRVVYSPQNEQEKKKEMTVRGTESTATLTDLSPFTLYIVNVAGETSKGTGPFSDDALVRTSEDTPGPPSLGRIDALGETSISVSWVSPTEPRGLIQGYLIVAESFTLGERRRRAPVPVSIVKIFARSNESYKILSNLSEVTNYTIYIRASTSKGYGEKSKTATIVTPKRIPGAPRSLMATPTSSTSLHVTWEAPSVDEPTSYSVSYLVVDHPGSKLNTTTTTPFAQINLLSPYTYYLIAVEAVGGNVTSVTYARTLEEVPGPLVSFQIPEVSESSVLLEWEPPKVPNGRIGYVYIVTSLATGISKTVKLQPDELGSPADNLFRWRVADLNGFTEYRFIMRAFNIRYNIYGVDSRTKVIRTSQGKPGPPVDVRVESTRRSSFLVSWSPPEKPNGIITGYEITTEWANATGIPATFAIIYDNHPTARFQEVSGLEHPARYSVIIRAKTISGEGVVSETVYMYSMFQDPDDRTSRNLTYSNLTSTSVAVTWEEPSQTAGLWNYTVHLFKGGLTAFQKHTSLNINNTVVLMTNLTPHTLFSIEIVAGYSDGSLGDISDRLYVQTESSAPSSAPRNFTVDSYNSSAILLNWISPLFTDLNGVLCGFVVRYWQLGHDAEEIKKKEFSSEEHHGFLTYLNAYTEYVVTVAAETCNAEGEGPTARGQDKTKEGIPERPNVSLISRNSTWMRLGWSVVPNGVLFRIEINMSYVERHVRSGNVTSGKVEFNGLLPYHMYTVHLQAYSGGGPGRVEVKNVSTCPAAPMGFPLIHACNALGDGDTKNVIQLNWTDISKRQWRGNPEGYLIFLTQGNSSGTIDVNAPDGKIPFKQLANESARSEVVMLSSISMELNQWYTVTMAAKTMGEYTRPICHDNDSFTGPANSTCRIHIVPLPNAGDSEKIILLVSIIPACVALFALLLLIICCCYKRKRREKVDIDSINLKQMRHSGLYAADGGMHWLMTWPTYDEFQFSRDCLKVEGELGEGQFGKVFSAWAVGIVKDEERTRVAVKTMKHGSSRETAEDFHKEMEIMMGFQHPNIVRLLGVCTHEEPLYIITELMEHGDLKDFLRKARPSELNPSPLLSLQELIDIASQAAAGLAYLASSRFVHRDIAARNCLVGKKRDNNSFAVKISDFGMARDVYQDEYYRRKGGALPIRWMAPEAITDGKYTVESDVWSLGVLLWEIFSFGYQPYFGQNNESVMGRVLGGSLCLQRPPLCPECVHYLMNRCWERSPEERIEAREVADGLEEMLQLSKEQSYGDYGLILDRRYQSKPKNQKPRDTSPFYLDMSTAKSNSTPSSEPEYTPMAAVTPVGANLGIRGDHDDGDGLVDGYNDAKISKGGAPKSQNEYQHAQEISKGENDKANTAENIEQKDIGNQNEND